MKPVPLSTVSFYFSVKNKKDAATIGAKMKDRSFGYQPPPPPPPPPPPENPPPPLPLPELEG
ncbi:hypothetical protein CBW16_02325 [Flavobacteriaceae bacterium JJC]|nr:hypothetical protein CBW16_02325 [Flavobacteriaceae bacterium JJC]